MQYRKLGQSGPSVSAIGFGCYGLSSTYGAVDEADALAILNEALDLGVNFLDTSDSYGSGHNESLLSRLLKDRRDEVVLSSKFGNLRAPDGTRLGVSGDPAHVIKSCDASLARLGVDTIDLYYMHRVDPNVAIEETVGAMATLVKAGKVRHLGLCEAAPKTIRRAAAVHPIAALQMEYSLWSREIEGETLDTVRDLGMALVSYSPLGRGFLTGTVQSREDLKDKDRRLEHPRFQAENIERNRELLAPLLAVAERHNAKPAQIALAWLLSKGEDIIPIPGAAVSNHLRQNIGAVDIALTAEDIARLEETFTPGAAAGTRYPPEVMKRLGL